MNLAEKLVGHGCHALAIKVWRRRGGGAVKWAGS
jgi:hypothetical protein